MDKYSAEKQIAKIELSDVKFDAAEFYEKYSSKAEPIYSKDKVEYKNTLADKTDIISKEHFDSVNHALMDAYKTLDDKGVLGDHGVAKIFVMGTAASELIMGTTDTDLLLGAGGDDALIGFGGNNDILFGGNGNDIITSETSSGQVSISIGGSGNDGIYALNGNDILVGDDFSGNTVNGHDTLYGWDGNDTIVGDDYSSDLNILQNGQSGNGGNDLIYAGLGHDVVYGQEGYDLIVGNSGDDALFGGYGNDLLFGDDATGAWNTGDYFGIGNDKLEGGDGDDIIFGGNGGDYIKGGNGNDVLQGDSGGIDTGNDTIVGGNGNDLIYGNNGNDSLSGEDGDDVVFGDSQFFGTEINEMTGGQLTGNDILHGGNGNDILAGNSGDDTIYGDAGNDILIGDANFYLDNSFSYDSGFSLLFTGIGGMDSTVHYASYAGPSAEEILNAGANLYVSDNAGNDVLNGGDGNDILIDMQGSNQMIGGAGADIFYFNINGWEAVTGQQMFNTNGTGVYANGDSFEWTTENPEFANCTSYTTIHDFEINTDILEFGAYQTTTFTGMGDDTLITTTYSNGFHAEILVENITVNDLVNSSSIIYT